MIKLVFENQSGDALEHMIGILSDIAGVEYKAKWLEVDHDRAFKFWGDTYHRITGENRYVNTDVYMTIPSYDSIGYEGARGRHWTISQQTTYTNRWSGRMEKTVRKIAVELADHLDAQAFQLKLTF